ncbi:MAG TPA: MFS transporter [Caulobacteraceae bacterium]|jgi:sugar phosphate permease|nr:MFS transporter [Caulobacteraceae bacterium]
MGLLLAVGAVNYVDRIALSVAAPLIAAELRLRPSQMGVLLSAFLWAYAAAQVPVGALADRTRPRRLLGGAMLLWSGAQALTGLATGLPQLIGARLCLGLGEAPQFPVAARVVRGWFAEKDRGLATGVFNSASTLGPAIAPPIVTALMLAFGWRGAFVATGLAGAAVAIAWWALYRDRPEQADAEPLQPTGWLTLLSQPTLWAMAIGNFGSGYVTWFYAAWLPSYLETGRHLTVLQAGWTASIPFAFGFLGSLAGGWACDRLAKAGLTALASRKVPLVTGLVAGAAFTGLAVAAPSAWLAVAAISAALMFANVATASIWALAVVAAPAAAVGRIGAVQNMGGLLGGAAAPIVTGLLFEATHAFAAPLALTAAAGLAGALVYLLGVVREIRADPVAPPPARRETLRSQQS